MKTTKSIWAFIENILCVLFIPKCALCGKPATKEVATAFWPVRLCNTCYYNRFEEKKDGMRDSNS